MKEVIKFLELNGFTKVEPDVWANDLCSVHIDKDNYAVANNAGDTMCSRDHSIYWLIGVLTYMGFMNKDYKTNLS